MNFKRLFPVSALVLLALISFKFFRPTPTISVPPTNVKDTLSSSQLSYFARIGTGVSGNSQLSVNTDSGTNPSNTTYNLFVGDTVAIGTTNSTALTNYVVRDIGDTASFQINTGLAGVNSFSTLAIIATRSAIHTVAFTPKTVVAGGIWEFLIKASTRSGEDFDDGIPDQEGFDLGMDVGSTNTGSGTRLKAADVTCPFGTASVGTTAVVGSSSYHVITCTLGAGVTHAIDVGVTMTIGRDLTTGSQIINPSAAASHVRGTADTYLYFVRHKDSGGTLITADTASGRVATVEAVRVTATIDPSITFTIGTTEATGVGGTPCGYAALGSAAGNTTAASVAFGSVTLGAFNNLAQYLTCVTNADNGYIVTVYEGDRMKQINTGTTIPDTNCDGGTCNYTTAAAWATDTTESGFGYTIQNLNVGVTVFSYPSGHKAFGVGSAQAQQIMSNTNTPTTTERALVCYRLVASTTQEAGNYENKLIYTATATF